MAASKIIVSTSTAVTEDGPISAMEEKHEFILQDGENAIKTTLIIDAVGTGMAIQTAKSCIKVEPSNEGRRMVVKVESSYKLLPVPSVENAQEENAETHERIIAEINEMGGASNCKVKLD